MSSELFHYGYLLFLVLGIALLAVAVFFFFKFDIRSIIDMKSGRGAKRTIQQMEEVNAQTGKLRNEPAYTTSHRKGRERIVHPQAEKEKPNPAALQKPPQGQRREQSGGQRTTFPVHDRGKTVLPDGGSEETTLLGGSEETTLLSGGAMTLPGSGVEETTLLGGGATTLLGDGATTLPGSGSEETTLLGGGETTLLSGGAMTLPGSGSEETTLLDGGETTLLSGGATTLPGSGSEETTLLDGGETTLLGVAQKEKVQEKPAWSGKIHVTKEIIMLHTQEVV